MAGDPGHILAHNQIHGTAGFQDTVNDWTAHQRFASGRPWVDVTASPFGADPTGALDSTAAIQAAIDYAITLGGGLVYLPAGLYLISAALVLGSSVQLVGAGMTLTEIRQSSLTADFITATSKADVGVAKLTLTSVVGRTAGCGIRYVTCSGWSTIEAVRLDDCYNGIDLDGTGAHCRNIFFKHSGGAGVWNRGMYLYKSVSTHIYDLTFSGGGATLGAGNAWLMIDSGCDTVMIDGIEASQASPGIIIQNSLPAGTHPPRWLNISNFYVETNNGATDCLAIKDDSHSIRFSNGNLNASRRGASISGGKSIKFVAVEFVGHNNEGAHVSNAVGKTIKDVVFDNCTFSDNSEAANGGFPHLTFEGSATTHCRYTNCDFSNNIEGNANEVSYCVYNDTKNTYAAGNWYEDYVTAPILELQTVAGPPPTTISVAAGISQTLTTGYVDITNSQFELDPTWILDALDPGYYLLRAVATVLGATAGDSARVQILDSTNADVALFDNELAPDADAYEIRTVWVQFPATRKSCRVRVTNLTAARGAVTNARIEIRRL